MSRIRRNFLQGELSDPILISDTEIASAEFASLPVIESPDIMVLTLDPNGEEPEIVHVVEHEEDSALVTVERGKESTDGRAHESETRWVHALTADEFPDNIVVSDDINEIVYLTRAEYQALDPPDDETSYHITDDPEIEDGREVELGTSTTHVQWRYVGDEEWTDLVALSSLAGPAGNDGEDGDDGADGSAAEFQVTATHVQWRLVGDETWMNLVALTTITGSDGTDGEDGDNGVDGAEVELQASATHIQWRYVGATTWTNLVALADIAPDPITALDIVEKSSSTNSLLASDMGKIIHMTNTDTDATLSFPTNATVPIPVGSWFKIVQIGTATATCTHSLTIDFLHKGPYLSFCRIAQRYGSLFVYKSATDTWVFTGDVDETA